MEIEKLLRGNALTGYLAGFLFYKFLKCVIMSKAYFKLWRVSIGATNTSGSTKTG